MAIYILVKCISWLSVFCTTVDVIWADATEIMTGIVASIPLILQNYNKIQICDVTQTIGYVVGHCV